MTNLSSVKKLFNINLPFCISTTKNTFLEFDKISVYSRIFNSEKRHDIQILKLLN
jgi:hypothetical protein